MSKLAAPNSSDALTASTPLSSAILRLSLARSSILSSSFSMLFDMVRPFSPSAGLLEVPVDPTLA
eukprot:CAMPEP_0173395752 /NCGR_PEP_ID=MMETSP1356-20130122/33254_1 /TAXON_ID=77927 ORGANISM="Hemiselmis virescens, Strain PCC157" /NCGR_SAMPLE_ID=MMETSP1356 /ASSEMBLY_ACC=CAM_ASM_000847 /LENGTH=64 /DNA_ID=CAMNT_0014354593 /DNA_START=86 /DNA_END=277 /DNA_ORIENTATION=+